MSFTIRIHDEAVQTALKSAGDSLKTSLMAGLDQAGQIVAVVMKEEAPKGFSLLTNSIHMSRPSDLVRVVTTGVDYAGFIHDGRNPGRFPNMRPGSAFAEWVRLRVVGARASRKKGGQEQVDSLTFLIGRAIARKGIKANPFAERAFSNTESRVIQLMRDSALQGFMP